MLSKEEIEKAKEIVKSIPSKHMDILISEDISISKVLNYIQELETREQKLIEKLEKDVVNITKTLQDGKHRDDYSRCRLKAYRTKTNEILSIVKGEKK